MYKLQAKISKEEPKNGTRKTFRGGANSETLSESQSSSASSEYLPVDQSITTPIGAMPESIPPQSVDQSIPPPATDFGAPQASDLGAPPATDFGAPPASDLGAPQATDFGAPPASDFGAPPATDLGAPQATDFGAPPASDFGSPPANEFETSIAAPTQTEVFGEQPIVTGEGESAEIEAFRNMMGTSPETQQVFFYMNTNISTEENRDKSYKREGVLHFTDSVSVGANQNTIMSLGSVIGNRGIETTTYDKLRNIALQKVGIILGESRRCYNTKIGFERNGETILVHIYGTVYMKKSEQPTV